MGIKDVVFPLRVDFKKSILLNEPVVTQNDNIIFVVDVLDDDQPFDLSDISTFTLVSERPRDTPVMTVGKKTGENEITFDFGSNEVAKIGTVNATIQLYDVDGRVSAFPFTYKVRKDPVRDYVPSENEETLIEIVLGQGPAILKAAEDATADAFQATTDLTRLKENVVKATSDANNAAEFASTEGNRASTEADRANEAASNAEEVYNDILPVLPNIKGWGYDPVPFNPTTTYGKNNIVSHEGSTFISLVDVNTGNMPTFVPNAYWGVMARKGVDGTGAVSSVNGVEPNENGDVELLIPDLTETTTKISSLFNLTPSIMKIPLQSNFRGWQGVAVYKDLIYVFTDRNENFNLENIISIYSLDGKLLSEKRNAYTGIDQQGKFMSFGDGNEIDGFLYLTAYNINDGGNPLISRIVKFNIADLSIQQVYEIGGNAAESVTKYDDSFWVVYHDVAVIRKFDMSFNLLQEYNLSVGDTPYSYFQGSLWEGNTFYANLHGHNLNGDTSFSELRKYEFDGVTFRYVESIPPPTDGSGQGLSKYGDYYFWNDRPNNMIIISKSIKRGNIFTEFLPYQNEFSFKPPLLNGWEAFDAIYDRTARVTVINGLVYLSGIIKNLSNPNVYDGLTPIIKIPKRFAPKYSINVLALSDKGPMRIAIVGKNSSTPSDQLGNVNVQNLLLYENIGFLSLDGISYPILD